MAAVDAAATRYLEEGTYEILSRHDRIAVIL